MKTHKCVHMQQIVGLSLWTQDRFRIGCSTRPDQLQAAGGLGSVGLIKRAFCPGCYGLDLTLKCTELCSVCVREADFIMTSEFLER